MKDSKQFQAILIGATFILGIIILFSFIYLASTPVATAEYLLSFTGGVSNIVLPCTLPLVFIIVPLALAGKGRKGIFFTVLFGTGLLITLTIYGAVIAYLGSFVGLDTATRVMYSVAGIAAFVFGLSELKLIKLTLPHYAKMPAFMQKRGEYMKVFLLGLLLGNAGVGCPNPVTYVVLTFAATTGNILQGALLMLVNAIGRVVPLLFFVALGLVGINAVPAFTKKMHVTQKATAWALVLLGSFILLNGVFGHLWYEGGIFHEGLNAAFMLTGGEMLGETELPEEIEELQNVPFQSLGPWFNLLFLMIPLGIYWRKYPDAKKEVFIVFLIFLLWSIMMFNLSLNAHKWLYG